MGTASTMKMTDDASRLYGNFADQTFPELLVHLHGLGKTGILYTVSDRVKKKIYFQDGIPTGARSNIKSELIGEMLVAKGVISREHQRFALEAHKKRKISFGAVLVQEGVIFAEELFVQARRQFLTVLFSLFGMRKGNYKFEECDLPSDGYYYDVAFSNMLVFGMRQISNLDTLENMVGDRSQIPTPGDRFLDYSKIMFTVKELSVINQVDGSKSIDEIVRASDVEPLTVFKTLLILMHHDFIGFKLDMPEDEGEEIVELEESTKLSLGYQEYCPSNPTEEQAVAGSDFKISPEGIHPAGEPSAEAVGSPEVKQDLEQAVSEETVVPEATPNEPPEERVIDLDAENLDEVLSAFHDGVEIEATASADTDALSPGNTQEGESLPETGTLPLEARSNEKTESDAGPVTSAFRVQQPEHEDKTAPEGFAEEQPLPQFEEEDLGDRFLGNPEQESTTSPVGEDDGEQTSAVDPQEPLPQFEEEDLGDRFLGNPEQESTTNPVGEDDGEQTSAVDPQEPQMAPPTGSASVKAPPPPALEAEAETGSDPNTGLPWDASPADQGDSPAPQWTDAADERPVGQDAATATADADGPSPFLADPGPARYVDEAEATEQAGAEPSVIDRGAASESGPPAQRKRSPAFALLLVLVVGGGIFAWTPWRTDLQDWVFTRLGQSGNGAVQPAANPTVEIPVGTDLPVADGPVSNENEAAVAVSANTVETDDVGASEASGIDEGAATTEDARRASGASEGATAAQQLPEAGDAQAGADLEGVPSENPALAAAAALYPVEDWWSQMQAWTARVRELPRSKFTIQVQITENIDFVWEDLKQLLPEHDAMVLRYRIKDWAAYTLIVGIYDSRAQGMEALQTLPPEILRLGPLVKTMATIQKGLVEPVANP